MLRHCLIVESTPLIAHDLALTAREYGLTPIIAADDQEALDRLAANAGAQISLAFVHQKESAFAASPLCRKLEGLRVRIVLMGSTAAEGREAAHWSVLDWPFTTGHVTALLDALGLRRPGSCES